MNGIELLHNLRKAEKTDKSPKYDKIVVIGHGLGTIVACDMLASLSSEYHGVNKDTPPIFKQGMLGKSWLSVRQKYGYPYSIRKGKFR